MSARLLTCAVLLLPATFALADARLERPLSDDVRRIAFDARGELTVVTGSSPGVIVEADDEEALEALAIEVKGDRLELRRENDALGLRAFLTRDRLRVRVVVRDLEHLQFAGRGDLHISGVRDGALRVELSGSVDCSLEELDLDELRVEIAGSADCELSGSTRHQRVAISGRGDYLAYALATERTEVKLSGMGGVEVRASGELDVDVSGMGRVKYEGSPRVRERVSGLGSVARAGGP